MYDDLFTLPLLQDAPYPSYIADVEATLSVSTSSYLLDDILELTVTQYSISDIDHAHPLAPSMLSTLAALNQVSTNSQNECNCSDEGICE